MGLDRAVLFRLATSERLERAVKRSPGGEAAAWRAASRYVAGRSLAEAQETVAMLLGQGHGVSVDLFGERVSDPSEADRVLAGYLELADGLPPPPADVWLSVDLSHLALSTDATAAADRLAAIAGALPHGRRVQVGAEEAAHADAVQACVLEVAARGLADRIGATLQANLLRTPSDADRLADAGVQVRLVKGAYVEPSGAHRSRGAHRRGLSGFGFRLADRGAAWSMATHDARLREALLLAHGAVPVEQLPASVPRRCPTSTHAAFPRGSTSPTGPTGFATGCAASPSPGAFNQGMEPQSNAQRTHHHAPTAPTLPVVAPGGARLRPCWLSQRVRAESAGPGVSRCLRKSPRACLALSLVSRSLSMWWERSLVR